MLRPSLPFCITGAPLIPVIHVAAIMGDAVPVLGPGATIFGDSNLLVVKPEEGRSLSARFARRAFPPC